MRAWFTFIFLGLFSFQCVFAQNLEQILLKIIDSESFEPISFSTVRIKASSIGVIADYNGELRIPSIYQNEIAIISCIGYEAQEIDLSELQTNALYTIRLTPQVEALNPVFISSRNKVKGINLSPKSYVEKSRKLYAKDIVLEAIAKIPENLSSQPHSYVGYYRDYQLVDNEFHNLNEAILETFDTGINTRLLDANTVSTVVYNFNQNKDFKQDTSLTKAYNGITKYIENSQILPRGGNEHTILSIHDPIRNYNLNTFSYVYELRSDFPKLHKFEKGKVLFLNNEPILVVNFKKARPHDFSSIYGIKTARDEYIQGSIYISLVDYSIHRFNYKVLVPRTNKVLFNVSLEYARQNDKMYLNYITFNNSFVVGEGFELREEKVEFDKKEQAFYITFNNTEHMFNYRTLKKANFKFRLGDQRLRTTSVNGIEGNKRIVRVEVENYDRTPIELNVDNIEDLTYEIKKVRDAVGNEIYQQNTIQGDQFREFFVQQVHEEHPLPDGLIVMDKNLPMTEIILNDFPDMNQYWINSPLMNKKYRD
ncbi:peptidase associated/transthyretin-like domain-containing protein [Winogradskyella tangerina]|uniref:hypothetical protein n=1 Tax=Winogradskyella tangerina TaxID=2023240 RepID=UPI000DBE1243|nr:hypothetical protein [Winogradskyella tangerina]